MQVFYYPIVDTARVLLVHDGSPKYGIGQQVTLDADDTTLDLFIIQVNELAGSITEYLATTDETEVYVPDLGDLFDRQDMEFLEDDEPLDD